LHQLASTCTRLHQLAEKNLRTNVQDNSTGTLCPLRPSVGRSGMRTTTFPLFPLRHPVQKIHSADHYE